MKGLKYIFPFFILLFVFTVSPQILYAQPIDPCPDPFEPCPVDDGVIMLIAAVVAIAAKKALDLRKKNSPSQVI